MKNNIERRFLTQPIKKTVRGEGDEKTPLAEGYAAVFDTRADLGWFTEEIEKGAFDDVLKDDTRALFNHDPNMILARSKNGQGTLELFVDDKGLGYRFEIPDTTAGRDLATNMDLGNIDQSSFGFAIKEDEWVYSEDRSEPDHRIIKKFARLYDVSPVTYPAYTDTTIAKRNYNPPTEEESNLGVYEARLRFINFKNAKK